MLLETLKDFSWSDEPPQVRFDDDGMHVGAAGKTDFWCCAPHGFRKDDGHFFYTYALGDFCCDLDWSFEDASAFSQCGIMVRLDVNNWFKASVMSEKSDNPKIATSLTAEGLSDLATVSLPQGINHIYYRLKKRKGCYTASWSADGVNYTELRTFYMLHDSDEMKTGAYICSPQSDDFTAVLHNLKVY